MSASSATPELGALAAHVDGLRESVDTVEARQDRLEARLEDARDSQQGVRRELADHRVEDATAFAGLRADIRALMAGERATRWMLGLLIVIGLINGLGLFAKLGGHP